ncbi:MAG: Alternative cytochrome c oxidase subunit 1 [Candidatus Hydrogenedentota bacterium]|jgi:cytochrome c oxidase subunit 1
MLLLAFGIVLLMRWQLAYPGSPVPGLAGFFDANHPWMPGGVLLPNFYNQLAGMHGTLMVFLAVVPLLVGAFGNYLVPKMIGAPDLAFPRVAYLGLLCQALGALFVCAGLFTQDGPASTGWTAYAPLSTIEPSGQTWWLLGIALVYLASLCLSVNLIVTIVGCRAAGMTLMRMPFFVWSQLTTAVLLLLSFPPLTAAALLQLMDRLRGTSFFVPSGLFVSGAPYEAAGGGSALLWQHLFWFLAHPEVYVLLLPALGIVAEVLTTNSRRPLHGYRFMVGALTALAFMSMLVWAHHMYLTGMGVVMSSFFQATTVIISLPSIAIGMGLLLTLWGGYLRFTMPMIFALGFLPMFALGGFTGLPLALGPTNIPLHDTNYVVGHFHYIAAPGILFALFAGVYHWFPRVFNREMSRWPGHVHFWLSLLGMNGVFMPMMLQGLAGVNRRLYDGGMSYAHGQDVHFLHVASTHSAFLLGVAQVFFLVNFFVSMRWGKPTTENPWEATTLEWMPRGDRPVGHPPYGYAPDGVGVVIQSEGDGTEAPRQRVPFSNEGMGVSLLLISLGMMMAALLSSFFLLRTGVETWPRLEYSHFWWLSRGFILLSVGALLWYAPRFRAATLPKAVGFAGFLSLVAAFAVAQEHAVVFGAHRFNAAAHNAYALYYLLTGTEGVLVLLLGLFLIVLAVLTEKRAITTGSIRLTAALVLFLIVTWTVHYLVFTSWNGTSPGTSP